MQAEFELFTELPAGVSAKEVVAALKAFYKNRSDAACWLVLEELRESTGFYNGERRIDLWAMHLWPSGRFERRAYEVKVSRSDFLAEIRNPRKRQYALQVSNVFYFAAPAGLIKPTELPEEAGLVEISRSGTVHVRVKAPWRKSYEPDWGFLASVGRKAAKLADQQFEQESPAPTDQSTEEGH